MNGVHEDQLVLDSGAASWREVDGEVVVLNLATSAYLYLNSTGSQLWPLLVRGTTVAEMAAELVARFGIDEGGATRDVRAFAEAVAAHRLLRPAAVPAR